MTARRRIAALVLAGTVAACATAPNGPSVLAMPPPNKPFAQFSQEDGNCRTYAGQMVAGQAEKANQRAAGAAVLGTLLGAAGGAIIGAPFRGGAGRGAGVGAGAGLLTGAAIGAGQSDNANLSIQQQYDNAYMQCMYSAGNTVQGPQPGPVIVQPAPVLVQPAPVVTYPPPVVAYPPAYRAY